LIDHYRRMRTRVTSKCPSEVCRCEGGPYHGQNLRVTSLNGQTSTAWFRVGLQSGRYVKGGERPALKWETKKP
jgi:hypothetical protein